MKEILEKFFTLFENELINFAKEDNLRAVLAAYNSYCIRERGCDGRIFNIENKDDYSELIDLGMSAKDVLAIYIPYERIYVAKKENKFVSLSKSEALKAVLVYSKEVSIHVLKNTEIDDNNVIFQYILERLSREMC